MRNKLFVSTALMLCISLAGASAFARWETHPASHMRFELPDDWTTGQNGNVLVARPAAPGLGLEFVGVSQGGAEARFDETAVLAGIARSLQGARITMPVRALSANGLRGFAFGGVGTRDGHAMEFLSATFGDGHGHGLIIVAFAAPGQLGAHRPALERIFASVQAAQ